MGIVEHRKAKGKVMYLVDICSALSFAIHRALFIIKFRVADRTIVFLKGLTSTALGLTSGRGWWCIFENLFKFLQKPKNPFSIVLDKIGSTYR